MKKRVECVPLIQFRQSVKNKILAEIRLWNFFIHHILEFHTFRKSFQGQSLGF